MERMGRILLGVALATAFAAPATGQEPNWRHDPEAARREAKETRRPILMDFGTTNCIWCRRLDASTFRDPAILKTLAERFVVVKVDAQVETALAQSFGINTYPTLVFCAPDGRGLFKQVGYVEAAGLAPLLERALRDSGVESGAGEAKPARPNVSIRRSIALPEPSGETQRAAQQLLGLAKDDYRAGHLVCALERCRQVAAECAGSAEAAEAKALAAEIRSDPERAKRVRAALQELLGELGQTDGAGRP